MGHVFECVPACAHWRDMIYGEREGAPTSLSKSGQRGPPVSRIIPFVFPSLLGPHQAYIS